MQSVKRDFKMIFDNNFDKTADLKNLQTFPQYSLS